MKKIKKVLFLFCAAVTAVVIFVNCSPFGKMFSQFDEAFGVRVSVADVIANGITEENKLITAMVHTECVAEIDETWFRAVFLLEDIFKKKQSVKFYGEALFTVDLARLESGDISFDADKEEVIIYISAPQFSHIYLDSDKTEAERTQNGLLRNGDMTFTAEDVQKLETGVINRMTEKLDNDGEMKTELESNAKDAVKELIQNILSASEYKTYAVAVEFK